MNPVLGQQVRAEWFLYERARSLRVRADGPELSSPRFEIRSSWSLAPPLLAAAASSIIVIRSLHGAGTNFEGSLQGYSLSYLMESIQ
jgi:hypothetical protein